jgi:hypothetical protein
MFMHRISLRIALVVWVGLLFAPRAHAFKIQTHVASANQVLDDLRGKVGSAASSAASPDTLQFKLNGRTLTVRISANQAYRAIINNEAYFRAGAIGPDTFPDIFTGQGLLHGNQAPEIGKLAERVSGGAVKAVDHDIAVPSEGRKGASQLRSIDFAMAMLDHLQAAGLTGAEYDQALAFIMGFFSHAVGDAFAHAWVNTHAGGAWSYTKGHGMFGWETEEVKHVVIEGLVDSRVPGNLQNRGGQTGGVFDRMDVRAPVAFLDGFFSKRIPNAPVTGDRTGDYAAFLQYYRNIDQFYGGPAYAFFNLQVDAADQLVNWTQMRSMMAFLARHQEGEFTKEVLDIADWPPQQLKDLQDFVQGDLLSFATAGYVRCDIFPDATSLEVLRGIWSYLGGFLARAQKFKTKAEVVRQNWIRLSECTSQNLVRLGGDQWSPADPTKNRDACAELADRPWSDQPGGQGGLWRGSIREGADDDNEFLRDLKAYFRGSGDDTGVITDKSKKTLEHDDEGRPLNDHRKFGPNLARLKHYLLGVGFVLDDLEDIVITDRHETSLQPICEAVQRDDKRRCLNGVVVNAAAVAAGTVVGLGECGVEYWNCRKDALDECLHSACSSACKAASFDVPRRCLLGTRLCTKAIHVGFPCDTVCAGVQAGCEATAGSLCTVGGVSFKIRFLPRVRIPAFEIPGCKSSVHNFCQFVGGHEGDCLDTVLPKCEGQAALHCPRDIINRVMEFKDYGELLVKGVHKACNMIDEARAIVDDYDTPQERRAFLQRQGVPLDEIERLIQLQGAIADKLRQLPPEAAVNAVFLPEDLREDPLYAATFYGNLARAEASGATMSDGPSKQVRQTAVARLRWLADMALQNQDAPLLDLRDTSNMTLAQLDAYLRFVNDEIQVFVEAIDMEAIPVPPGPTAQRILADIGGDFVNTFTPFFNVVQAMKLVPLVDRDDVAALVAQVPGHPWLDPTASYSRLCREGELTSVYCDSIPSFDDPTCLNCTHPADVTADVNGWVRGRGLVLANPSCAANPNHVLSPVVLGASEQAYRAQYQAVFRVPVCDDELVCAPGPTELASSATPSSLSSALVGVPAGPAVRWERSDVLGPQGLLRAVVPSTGGGVTLVGSDRAAQGLVGVIVDLDRDGHERWRHTIAPVDSEVVLNGATATHDAGIVVAGSIAPLAQKNTNTDVLVVKLMGNAEIWTRRFGTLLKDQANSVREARDGALFLGGSWGGYYEGGTGASRQDPFSVGLEADGSDRWAPQQIDTLMGDVFGVAEDCGQGLVGVGYDGHADGTADALAFRFGGPMLNWGTSWTDASTGNSVEASSDWGALALISRKTSTGVEAALRKVDSRGTTDWVRSYPGTSSGRALVRYRGGYLAGVAMASGSAGSAVVNVDAAGLPLWASTMGPAGEVIRGMTVTSEGAIVVATDSGARLLR